MRRLGVHVARGNDDVFGKRAVARHAEHRTALVPHRRVGTPAQHRVDHDRRADGGRIDARTQRGDHAGPIGAQRSRQLDARIQSLRDEHVAPIECRALDLNEDLAGARRGIGNGFNPQVLRAADFIESYRFHRADLRQRARDYPVVAGAGAGGGTAGWIAGVPKALNSSSTACTPRAISGGTNSTNAVPTAKTVTVPPATRNGSAPSAISSSQPTRGENARNGLLATTVPPKRSPSRR